MELPAIFEPYRGRALWCCYPLIWDEKTHNGFGGYAKPPINPQTLRLAHTDDPETLGTYDEAAARVGECITFNGQRAKLEGVGLSLTLSGLLAVDLDSVVILTPDTPGQRCRMTREAVDIVKMLNTYTELSPSGNGLHLLLSGALPADALKLRKGKRDIKGGTAAEYQIMTAGYVTLSGDIVGHYARIEDRTAELAEFCRKYLAKYPAEADGAPANDPKPKAPKNAAPPPTGKGGFYTWERWKEEADGLNDAELMERIYTTPRIGAKVRALYEGGDISAYKNDHSEADAALMAYLYGFTHDEARTAQLFRASALYRGKDAKKDKIKSAHYYERTLNAAMKGAGFYIGTIKGEPTKEDRKAYAQAKEAEETARIERGARKYNQARRKASGSGTDAGEK